VIAVKRGDIYIADLNPTHGTEPGKKRPVVVVQTNLLNGIHPSTLICPITTNVKPNAKYLRVHLSDKETGLNKDSDIMVDQIRAIDNKRLMRRVGEIPGKQMDDLGKNLLILLDIISPSH
jgi:mRNA interferase MazF